MTPAAVLLAAGDVPPFFVDVALLIVAAAAIAYVTSRLRLVPIVGFLAAGVLLGPNALGLVSSVEMVDACAEIGIVLLLFTIGIEFSLAKLARMKRLILLGGGLQVGLTVAVVTGLVALAGVGWRDGVYTGFLVALSSTVIVLKLLSDRGETDSPRGGIALGLLIFQDLAVVVMVMLVPILAGGDSGAGDLAWVLGKAAGLIVAVLLVARWLMPKLLELVARTCSQEVFLLTVIAICLGTAYATSLAGVSLSLGAFLAGLVVSESRFSEHALGEILPLQVVFAAVTFVSVGMLLDLRFLLARPLLVLGVVAAVLALKAATTAASVLVLGRRWPLVLSSSLLLAQVGEFSFVLEREGRAAGLSPGGLGETGTQTFIAAAVVLMVLTPGLGALGQRLAARFGAPGRLRDETEAATTERVEELAGLRDHVILAGYGQAATRLARALQAADLPFVIATLSPAGADEAEAAGHDVLRADNTRMRTYELLGADRARAIVVADDDPSNARRAVSVARMAVDAEMRNEVPSERTARVVVRTRWLAEIGPLYEAGADRVVTDELESVVALFEEVLSGFGLSAQEVAERCGDLCSDGYETLLAGEPIAAAGAAGGPLSRRGRLDLEATIRLDATEPGTCSHLDRVAPVRPGTNGCEECLAAGHGWVHLRICMTCGHVGCCDDSPGRHATGHFETTGHPVIRSLEPGESWGWCFVDRQTL